MSDGIRVNFSSKEADTTPRDVEPLPTGKYLCTITDGELRFSTSEKHNGEPYYSFEFTVTDDVRGGQYRDRKCWTNAMLFDGALYTISLMMKALAPHHDEIPMPTEGDFEIPVIEAFFGKELVVAGKYVGEQVAKDGSGKTYSPKFEPKSFFDKTTWRLPGATSKAGPISVGGKTSTTKPVETVTFLKK